MRNPWCDVEIPGENYVHRLDRSVVATSSTPPQPYLGSFTKGRVCWLLGGFAPQVGPASGSAVLARIAANLEAETPNQPNHWVHPNLALLDPVVSQSGDVAWWSRATKPLREALRGRGPTGHVVAREMVACRLFVLEAYPYAALRNPGTVLPTHRYTAYLLREWLRSGRLVVLGRGTQWLKLVPEIAAAADDGQVIVVKNRQTSSLGAGNLPHGGADFDRIVQAMRGGLT
jgi:hypothetical protein